MSFFKQNVRIAIAALCSVAYLTSVTQVAPLLAAALMHDNHEHELEIVAHDGHEDLVLHHTDDHSAHEDGEFPAMDNLHSSDEHPHGCHVVQFASESTANAVFVASIRAPVADACVVELPDIPILTGWRLDELRIRVRPPPWRGSSVLLCLRTTVLVV